MRPAKRSWRCRCARQLLTFEQEWTDKSDGHTLPSFVTEELHDFLGCGILARGFGTARLPSSSAPTATTTYPTPSPPGSLLFADLDADGNMDLVAAGTGRLTLWRGAADGRLAEPVDIPVDLSTLMSTSPYLLLATDINQDGVLDLFYVYLGDGHGGFSSGLSFPCFGEQQYGNFLMGDLNNDTKLDIIVTRRDGWRVLLNTCP